ncbi:MAG TPA: 50S ribosomal protein L4 [Oligoflexia bacterium]|nr:50S ribosomal protein L4 [Oligoflexia bacterium]
MAKKNSRKIGKNQTPGKVVCNLHKTDGAVVGTYQPTTDLFESVWSPPLVHQAVVWQRNNLRSGTHSTLSRGMMKGGGRKPWKQKGTGRARAGSNVSPLWVGGAVAHGPKPRDYSTRFSLSSRAIATATLLADKLKAGRCKLLESFDGIEGKTKSARALLEALGLARKKTLVIITNKERNNEIFLSFRNITGVKLLQASALNPLDLIKHRYLLLSQETFKEIEKKLEARI